MNLFKCKMCGGDLEIVVGATVAECEYCGTRQTVPKSMDENLQNLFNRANTLRIKSEFDKAAQLYEKIIQVDTMQSEAYWGLILCKYGIEYVDDPVTFKKIPTCHRASFDPVVADEDYKAAVKYADVSQRALYEEQAKEIDRIQREILALAQREETYDVFICYKETDSEGRRTQDSVIANDIYYQLTQEGFKVFYAAITLEGKLGSAYEPIIFAALNSAKVMLAIGTKPEHFNAVWVKNEWARFLKIVKNDRSKLLIPCYRDMDAYELPEEFAHLQAQDMSKIGFINDVVRGIGKVINKNANTANAEKAPMGAEANANTTSLLDRAFIFVEDKQWKKADEYLEKVLDLEPHNGLAYLGKLMVVLSVSERAALSELDHSFEGNDNYQKVLRFGDTALVDELKGYVNAINVRNKTASHEASYVNAVALREKAMNEMQYRSAAKMFAEISGYKDSDALRTECLEKADVFHNDEIYGNALAQKALNTVKGHEKAIELFRGISTWKDADEQIITCEEELQSLKVAEEKARLAAVAKRKRAFKVACIVTPIAALMVVFLCLLKPVIIPTIKYATAESKMEAGEFETAAELYAALGNYKDSSTQRKEALYQQALSYYNANEFEKSNAIFNELSAYKDSKDKIHKHEYTTTVTKTATCAAEGEKTNTCNTCGYLYVEKVATLEHSYTSKITKAATCSSEGEKTNTCNVCNQSTTEKIAKLEHVYTSKVVKAATCTTAGETAFTCKCGDTYTKAIAVTAHKYTEKITKAATCIATGTKTFTCSCGHKYTETIATGAHNYSAATCTAAEKCKTCGATGKAALGHTTTSGTCSRCKTTFSFKTITYSGPKVTSNQTTEEVITGINLSSVEGYKYKFTFSCTGNQSGWASFNVYRDYYSEDNSYWFSQNMIESDKTKTITLTSLSLGAIRVKALKGITWKITIDLVKE